MENTKVTYRDIAKMLVKAMPVDDEDFRTKVEEYITAIQKLDKSSRTALKMAYQWQGSVPKSEREDFFQDIAIVLLKSKVEDEKLAYAIARCDWKDFWKKRHIRQDKVCLWNGIPTDRDNKNCSWSGKPKKCSECPFRATRQMTSLDSVVEDSEGTATPLIELITGECEFEAKQCDRIDARAIWNRLPENIRPIIQKRLEGKSMLKAETNTLQYWVKTQGYKLLLAG